MCSTKACLSSTSCSVVTLTLIADRPQNHLTLRCYVYNDLQYYKHGWKGPLNEVGRYDRYDSFTERPSLVAT